MAHVVSSKELRTILCTAHKDYRKAVETQAKTKQVERLAKVADDMITSDAEDRNDVREMAEEGVKHGDPGRLSKLYARLNRASRNLMGGDHIINSSIQEHRDVPLQTDGKVPKYIERRLASVDAFWGGSSKVPAEFRQKVNSFGQPISSTTDS